MSELYAQITAAAKALENETTKYLIDMTRIPSLSCSEEAVVNLIKGQMISAGFDEVRIDGLGNVVGRIGNGPRIMAFDAHIDTVDTGDKEQWAYDPYDARVVEGMVRGRGTVDQKGGMASMITAGRLIQQLKLNREWTLYFTGTVMEEDCDGLCWQYLINEEKIIPELVVITEPTNMNIYRGHRGRMEMAVTIKGISCHGSAPERGENAIYKMARIILEIEKLNERLQHDDFLGKGTVTVTQVTSESPSLCAVADGARIHLDRRLTAGETKDTAVKEVQDAASRAGFPNARVEVLQYNEKAYTGLIYPTEKYYPTWTLETDSPYLLKAVTVYKSLFNKTPLVDKWTFSTNAVAIAGMRGIPCIGMGPGNEIYAHAPNEAAPVQHLTDAAAFYAGLVAKLNELS